MHKQIDFLTAPLRAVALALAFCGASSVAFAAPAHHDEHESHDDHQDHVGPHGGRVMEEGDVTLELAIFETGVPPQFRAWVYRDDEAVEQAQLEVQLSRLGGDIDRIPFTRHRDYWLGEGVVYEPHSFDVQATLELDGEVYQWQWESHEGRTQIAPAMARQLGVTSAVAGPGIIERSIVAYGRAVIPPGQKAHVRARFAGMLTSVTSDIGNAVTAGQVLAQVEANESLNTYAVRAPMDGIITERHASIGEATTDRALFTIAALDPLWAELKIFPAQRLQVSAGQAVAISSQALHQHSTLRHLLPSNDNDPFVIGRAKIDNRDNRWMPGLLLQGEITVDTASVPLVVDNRALQPFRDWTVVFVQVGDIYEIRPLELGRSDDKYTEVLAGLKAGDRYVVQNSYLIKADIEKSGAAHAH